MTLKRPKTTKSTTCSLPVDSLSRTVDPPGSHLPDCPRLLCPTAYAPRSCSSESPNTAPPPSKSPRAASSIRIGLHENKASCLAQLAYDDAPLSPPPQYCWNLRYSKLYLPRASTCRTLILFVNKNQAHSYSQARMISYLHSAARMVLSMMSSHTSLFPAHCAPTHSMTTEPLPIRVLAF